jgi:thiol-disulfide isomerase/thioredoxin
MIAVKKSFLVFSFALLTFAQAQAASTTNIIQPAMPPEKVPPLVFVDGNGVQHVLADYRGHYVLLNIWATWCVPCVKEMPSLEALQANFDPQKLVVLPLSEDRDKASVIAFYKKYGIAHLPVAVDSAGIAPQSLHLEGFPTTLLIDPQGMEIAHMEGDADWNSVEMKTTINAQINASTRP